MKVTAIKTVKVFPNATSLFGLLDKHVKKIPESSVLVITSKIVALCEGSVAPLSENKDQLITLEADFYIPREESAYRTALSITHSAFISSAGIDESNAAGQFVLLPRNAQKTANTVRQYLKKRFRLKKVGVILSDSRSIPLRKGVIGVALAWSGFQALSDYRGKKDLFGHPFKFSIANVADALAVTAVTVMGEGREQTPLALIKDLPQVRFVDRNPTPKERSFFFISPKDDLFAPIFNLKKTPSREENAIDIRSILA